VNFAHGKIVQMGLVNSIILKRFHNQINIFLSVVSVDTFKEISRKKLSNQERNKIILHKIFYSHIFMFHVKHSLQFHHMLMIWGALLSKPKRWYTFEWFWLRKNHI